MQYRVSVIMPTYNSGKTLRSCIDSLENNLKDLPQDDCEILVPCRNSQDETIKILAEYPRYRILPDTMPGISAAYNLGVKEAQGNFGVFLNSDDELGPSFLRAMLEIAESHEPARHVVYSSVQFIDVNGKELYYRHPAPYLGFIQRHYSIILHPNAIYPMALLKKYPFEILSSTLPRDREQVYELMKEAAWSRTRKVWYRYRIWSSSETVKLANSNKVIAPVDVALIKFLGRLYVQSFESNKLERLLSGKLGSRSYWGNPAK